MKKIIITGNVGQHPQQHTNQMGQTFITFPFAVKSSNKQTDWVDVMCNGKITETVLQYVTKGTKLLIEGTPSVNAYVDSEGRAIGKLRVYLNYLEFVGSSNNNNANTTNNVESSEIPF